MIARGAVHWARMDPTEGHEQAGARPVLVLSDERFNARGVAIVVPLTSAKKAWRYPFLVELGSVGGKIARALPGQVRAISVERLMGHGPIDSVSSSVVDAVVDAVSRICGRSREGVADNDG